MATERQYVTMTDLFTSPGIQPGARVRVEGFVDLEGEVGTVRAIGNGRAHIVWDRPAMGVSWLRVEDLILLPESQA